MIHKFCLFLNGLNELSFSERTLDPTSKSLRFESFLQVNLNSLAKIQSYRPIRLDNTCVAFGTRDVPWSCKIFETTVSRSTDDVCRSSHVCVKKEKNTKNTEKKQRETERNRERVRRTDRGRRTDKRTLCKGSFSWQTSRKKLDRRPHVLRL